MFSAMISGTTVQATQEPVECLRRQVGQEILAPEHMIVHDRPKASHYSSSDSSSSASASVSSSCSSSCPGPGPDPRDEALASAANLTSGS